jgi:hypothetical protein
MGALVTLANTKLSLAAMTPQPGLSSTGYCLAHPAASGAYVAYAPNGGTFTVDLSHTPGALNVEWFDPANLTWSSGGQVQGGGTSSFTTPFGNDALLYLH